MMFNKIYKQVQKWKQRVFKKEKLNAKESEGINKKYLIFSHQQKKAKIWKSDQGWIKGNLQVMKNGQYIKYEVAKKMNIFFRFFTRV